jgi:hypothetical protein
LVDLWHELWLRFDNEMARRMVECSTSLGLSYQESKAGNLGVCWEVPELKGQEQRVGNR